jgi:mRNA interferase HigB
MQQARKHRETVPVLQRFYGVARKAKWHGLNEVRQHFPSADQVGNVLIFDVLGGSYRLVTTVNYTRQTLFIKVVLTHAEHDRKEWMKWA